MTSTSCIRGRRASIGRLGCNARGLDSPNAVDVGPGTKWNNPIKKRDVDSL